LGGGVTEQPVPSKIALIKTVMNWLIVGLIFNDDYLRVFYIKKIGQHFGCIIQNLAGVFTTDGSNDLSVCFFEQK
jgi:hypothetical protein